MGRTVYWMNVSLDLFIERDVGEEGGGAWMSIGEQVHRDFNLRTEHLALMIEGRTSYEIMERFWPAAADDEAQPEHMREYGRIWTTKPKVLVSNSRASAPHNTRVVGGARALDELARIREQTDGEIAVGGATLATQLLQHGILDELLLYYHPVILGSGRPLFDTLAGPLRCDLLEHGRFDNGVLVSRYAVRADRA